MKKENIELLEQAVQNVEKVRNEVKKELTLANTEKRQYLLVDCKLELLDIRMRLQNIIEFYQKK